MNDHSDDGTGRILQNLVDQHTEDSGILNLESNQGKAEAVRQGMLWTLKNKPNCKYAGFIDADLATPLNEVLELSQKIKQYSNPAMLMGSRVKIYGSSDIQRSETRHYIGRIIATFISRSLQLAIYDTQCGFKFFRNDVLKNLFEEKFISKWLFDVEIIFRLKKLYAEKQLSTQLFEIPLKQWHEKGGSKISWLYIFLVPFDLMKIRRKYKKS